ncbi:MAG: FtsX-like permease family protein, partial [Chloroflexota bacterium]
LIKWEEWARSKRVNFNKEGYNQLVVRAEDPSQVVEIADQINELGYQASTPQSYVEGINSFFVILQLVFGGIGAISLLVAAIGIANTMTMAILERTREIGLMKAIGATNRDVLSIFLGESAGIGLIGGIGGVLLGWGGSLAIGFLATTFLAGQGGQFGGAPSGMTTYTPAWLPVFALLFSTLVGLISGLYPSLRAATLVPVNALKYE